MDVLITIRYVAEIVFIVLFIIFVIYAFIALKKISASIEKVEENTVKVYEGVTPVLKEVSAVVADIKEIADKSKVQYYKVENTVNTLVEKVNGVSDVIGFAGNKAKHAVTESSNLISAVSKGVKAF